MGSYSQPVDSYTGLTEPYSYHVSSDYSFSGCHRLRCPSAVVSCQSQTFLEPLLSSSRAELASPLTPLLSLLFYCPRAVFLLVWMPDTSPTSRQSRRSWLSRDRFMEES